MDERLFCIDVAVENLTILRDAATPNKFPAFSSTSLLAQFLAFAPLRLADDLHGTLLSTYEERKIVRLQTGKSAMLRANRRNLIDQLKAGNLVVALIGNNQENPSSILLLNAQLSLSPAATYFLENENGVDDQGFPLKFTSAGVTDMKDEFGRKRAELQIGYRLWQLGASMDDFISQHEQLEQRSSGATWLPTSLIGHRVDSNLNDSLAAGRTSVTTDTQTDAKPTGLSDVEIQTEGYAKDSSVGERSPSISISMGSGKNSKSSVESGRNSVREVSFY